MTALRSKESTPVGSSNPRQLDEDGAVVVQLSPRNDLFADNSLLSLQDRATVYLRAGIPVHLRGPSGTGKSTLALQIAARLGRPIAMLSGDHGVSSKDIIGKEGGTKTRSVVDKFIHNVQKQETETTTVWTDSVLTSAVVNGYTLFYDEFTRSPPEANNAFLMALEERRLLVPNRSGADSYIPAHPEFRAIFTSNPEDYAGVRTPQDALIDRMITLEVAEQERSTEIGIVCARTGIDAEAGARVVDLVRAIRAQAGHRCASLRSAIMIGSVVASEGVQARSDDSAFVQLCVDALFVKWAAEGDDRHRKDFVAEVVNALADIDEGDNR